MFYHARYYAPTVGRFVQADTIVPNLENSQDLNRYSYVRNNPLRYTDPSGHGIKEWLQEKMREWSERTISLPLVYLHSDQILRVATARGIDPVVLAAVIYHESQAQERILGGDQIERIEVKLRKDPDYASIGVGQIQLRRAKELEDAGYIEPRASRDDRVSALLNTNTAIEYSAALLQYNYDQLDAWAAEHSVRFSDEARTRLAVLSYNWGWAESDDPEAGVVGALNEAFANDNLNQEVWELMYETVYLNEAFRPGNIRSIEDLLHLCSQYGEWGPRE
jgi:uncharacterized protein RhaS with RHS repeats